MYLPREQREERCLVEGLLVRPATLELEHPDLVEQAGDPGMEVVEEAPGDEVVNLPPSLNWNCTFVQHSIGDWGTGGRRPGRNRCTRPTPGRRGLGHSTNESSAS